MSHLTTVPVLQEPHWICSHPPPPSIRCTSYLLVVRPTVRKHINNAQLAVCYAVNFAPAC